jgi:hypothetical protein
MPNRYICDVLEAMRKCSETLNFSYLNGLIEEAQNLANRMENAIQDISDIETYSKKRSELRKEIKELIKEKNQLNRDLDKPLKDDDSICCFI